MLSLADVNEYSAINEAQRARHFIDACRHRTLGDTLRFAYYSRLAANAAYRAAHGNCMLLKRQAN
jgi:hypothetical protein